MVALALMAAMNARADASLTLTEGTSRCITLSTQRDPAQPSQFVTTRHETPCTPTPENPVAVNDITAPSVPAHSETFLQLAYGFTYSDDGQLLAGPVELDPTLSTMRNPPPLASFEAGILSVHVDAQPGYVPLGAGFYVEFELTGGVPMPGLVVGNGVGGNGYVVFGLNDQPDRISGTIVVNVGVTPYVLANAGGITNVAVSTHVAAVPEPSTHALALVGLAAVAAAARRRRRNPHTPD